MDNVSTVSSFVGGSKLVKSKIRNDKALNSPQVTRRGHFMSICYWKAYASYAKIHFAIVLQPQASS